MRRFDDACPGSASAGRVGVRMEEARTAIRSAVATCIGRELARARHRYAVLRGLDDKDAPRAPDVPPVGI